MVTSVRAHFVLSKPEGVATVRWGVPRQCARYSLALGVVLLAAGGGLLHSSTVAGYGLLAVGLLQLLIAGVCYWILPSYAWAKRLAKIGEMTYVFGDEGIEVHALGQESSMKWTRLAKVVELPDLYILRLRGSTRRFPVPKRAFSSDDEQSAFRRVAAEYTSVEFR